VDETIKILSDLQSIEIVAVHRSVRDLRRLNSRYGRGRWRKLKGIAQVRLPDGKIIRAELHWYEAHGIGRREIKIKGPVVEN
jgi:hypothetical protein